MCRGQHKPHVKYVPCWVLLAGRQLVVHRMCRGAVWGGSWFVFGSLFRTVPGMVESPSLTFPRPLYTNTVFKINPSQNASCCVLPAGGLLLPSRCDHSHLAAVPGWVRVSNGHWRQRHPERLPSGLLQLWWRNGVLVVSWGKVWVDGGCGFVTVCGHLQCRVLLPSRLDQLYGNIVPHGPILWCRLW
jgi:hypothetical protein